MNFLKSLFVAPDDEPQEVSEPSTRSPADDKKRDAPKPPEKPEAVQEVLL